MKCHYCGEEMAENHSYCMCCGTRREQQAAPEELVRPVQPEVTVPEETVLTEFPVLKGFAAEAAPERKTDIPQPSRMAGKYLPRLQLPTGRGLGKMIFLGLLTFGIYPAVIWSRLATELNIVASRYDGRRTMPYFAMMALTPITLGIYAFVWMHKLCSRIGGELERRRISYQFGPSAFWLWNVLGCLILVGPFVFIHKLMKAMNRINADFNING